LAQGLGRLVIVVGEAGTLHLYFTAVSKLQHKGIGFLLAAQGANLNDDVFQVCSRIALAASEDGANLNLVGGEGEGVDEIFEGQVNNE
jgi:hypothetical protein